MKVVFTEVCSHQGRIRQCDGGWSGCLGATLVDNFVSSLQLSDRSSSRHQAGELSRTRCNDSSAIIPMRSRSRISRNSFHHVRCRCTKAESESETNRTIQANRVNMICLPGYAKALTCSCRRSRGRFNVHHSSCRRSPAPNPTTLRVDRGVKLIARQPATMHDGRSRRTRTISEQDVVSVSPPRETSRTLFKKDGMSPSCSKRMVLCGPFSGPPHAFWIREPRRLYSIRTQRLQWDPAIDLSGPFPGGKGWFRCRRFARFECPGSLNWGILVFFPLARSV